MFDVTSAPTDFVVENEEVVAKFLEVTAAANATWNETHSAEMLTKIAVESGMDEEAALASLSTFSFPSVEDQLSEAWLGGAAATFMKGVADVFVESGSIEASLDSYEDAVTIAPLAAIK